MNTTTATTTLLVLACATFAMSSLSAKDRRDRIRVEIEWAAVPAAVQATIKANAGNGKIGAIEKETRRGETTYEAEVKRSDGKTVGIEVAADGKLISVEIEEAEAD